MYIPGKGKSDPYAIITVGAQQWKTKHIDNNINPRWEYWCEVIIKKIKIIYLLLLSTVTDNAPVNTLNNNFTIIFKTLVDSISEYIVT